MSWGLRKQVLENGFQEAGKTYNLKVYSPDYVGMKAPVQAVIVCSGKRPFKIGKEKDKGLRSGYGVEKSVWINKNKIMV